MLFDQLAPTVTPKLLEALANTAEASALTVAVMDAFTSAVLLSE